MVLVAAVRSLASATTKRRCSFLPIYAQSRAAVMASFGVRRQSWLWMSTDAKETNELATAVTDDVEVNDDEDKPWINPWTNPRLTEVLRQKKRPSKNRFRQHVNPLSPMFQLPTEAVSPNWPVDVFDDCCKPLHLDIGCGKGGFLLALAGAKCEAADTDEGLNYLGLEIRPLVAQFARGRIPKNSTNLVGRLDFVGCNANVDLERLLDLYHKGDASSLLLSRVTVQFPDPHFKTRHAKRRVVTEPLVETLAKYMPPGAIVFLQSDVQHVLDNMRQVFGNTTKYFEDQLPQAEYLPHNLLGVPTERELSVLERELPVYRSVFHRTSTVFSASLNGDGDLDGPSTSTASLQDS